jgi:hypothetical protein
MSNAGAIKSAPEAVREVFMERILIKNLNNLKKNF